MELHKVQSYKAFIQVKDTFSRRENMQAFMERPQMYKVQPSGVLSQSHRTCFIFGLYIEDTVDSLEPRHSFTKESFIPAGHIAKTRLYNSLNQVYLSIHTFSLTSVDNKLAQHVSRMISDFTHHIRTQ